MKGGSNNDENRTGGHGFTSGVSPKKTSMQGKQITARQLTNHEGITILLREMQFMGSNTVGITSRHMDRYPACMHI